MELRMHMLRNQENLSNKANHKLPEMGNCIESAKPCRLIQGHPSKCSKVLEQTICDSDCNLKLSEQYRLKYGIP